jgi:two-component system, oxyanion-binding sensor
MDELRAGFLPLLDASILIAAHELGFAEANGIALKLVRETSWANVRDRISVGQFDAAHMLAPLPIAQNLGLSPLNVPLIVPFALGLGGNAITVSNAIAARMSEFAEIATGGPREAGQALRGVMAARRKSGEPPFTFAVVHDYSGHAYELRYWLAASGIRPDIDVTLTIVPPTMMSDAMASGAVDGFCVGEPWNSEAAALGHGRIVTTKAAIWRSSPEKVLGLRKAWAERNPEKLAKLIAALHRSAQWCASPRNREDLARILARPGYLGIADDIILRGLSGNVMAPQVQSDFLLFTERAANFPWQSHALWFYSQMARWKQIAHTGANARAAAATYRPDLYRQALASLGVALPGASAKVEGALRETTFMPASGGNIALGPDGFFDAVSFDPADIDGYLMTLATNDALHNERAD